MMKLSIHLNTVIDMKTFVKILGFAIAGTALMLCVAALAASMLRSCNRETVYCTLISIAALSMVAPLFTVECKKEWVEDVSIFCLAYFPMQALLVAALL